MYRDPVRTDPDLYRVVFENARVRVLEYLDQPGDKTHEHDHPDMLVIPLNTFRRRQRMGGEQVVEFEKTAHEVGWADAMTHAGENIGDTPSHSLFVEFK